MAFKSGFPGDKLTLRFTTGKELEVSAVKVDKGKLFMEAWNSLSR